MAAPRGDGGILERARLRIVFALIALCAVAAVAAALSFRSRPDHLPTHAFPIPSADDRILVTLERHMDCGVGLCGHCQLGRFFVCRDGPVFSLAELGETFGREGR